MLLCSFSAVLILSLINRNSHTNSQQLPTSDRAEISREYVSNGEEVVEPSSVASSRVGSALSGKEAVGVASSMASSGKEAVGVASSMASSGKEPVSVASSMASSSKEPVSVASSMASGGEEAVGPVSVASSMASSGEEAVGPVSVASSMASSGKEPVSVASSMASGGEEAVGPLSVASSMASSGKEAVGPVSVASSMASNGEEGVGPVSVASSMASSGKEAVGPVSVASSMVSSGKEAVGPVSVVSSMASSGKEAVGPVSVASSMASSGKEAVGPVSVASSMASSSKEAVGPVSVASSMASSGKEAVGPVSVASSMASSGKEAVGPVSVASSMASSGKEAVSPVASSKLGLVSSGEVASSRVGLASSEEAVGPESVASSRVGNSEATVSVGDTLSIASSLTSAPSGARPMKIVNLHPPNEAEVLEPVDTSSWKAELNDKVGKRTSSNGGVSSTLAGIATSRLESAQSDGIVYTTSSVDKSGGSILKRDIANSMLEPVSEGGEPVSKGGEVLEAVDIASSQLKPVSKGGEVLEAVDIASSHLEPVSKGGEVLEAVDIASSHLEPVSKGGEVLKAVDIASSHVSNGGEVSAEPVDLVSSQLQPVEKVLRPAVPRSQNVEEVMKISTAGFMKSGQDNVTPSSISAVSDNVERQFLGKCEIPQSGFKAWNKGVVSTFQPEVNVSCSRVLSADQVELDRVKKVVGKWKNAISNEHFKTIVKNCSWLRESFRNNVYNSESEKSFPIAFSLVVYDSPQQVLRLLRLLYRPQNTYCIHPDIKSPYKAVFQSIAKCFDNVIIPSKLENVIWGYYTILAAQMKCMQTLLTYRSTSKHKWRYVINLCGKELPLVTNREMVSRLSQLKGSSSIVAVPCGKDKELVERIKYSVKLKKGGKAIKPNHHAILKGRPFDLKLYHKSLSYNAISYAFGNFLVHDSTASKFYEFFKKCSNPEEHFYATLFMKPGVPGGYDKKMKKKYFKVAAVFWSAWNHKGSHKCKGKLVHNVCIVSAADLPAVVPMASNYLFFNKYFDSYDHTVMTCMEQNIVARNRLEYEEECLDIVLRLEN